MDRDDKDFIKVMVMLAIVVFSLMGLFFAVGLPVLHWLYIVICKALGVPQ